MNGTIRRLTLSASILAAALALAGCAASTVSKTPVTSFTPLPASTAAPAAATSSSPAPSDSSSSLTGTIGTTFTVTTTDDNGNAVSYEVTLDKVTQHAALAPYETLSNSADHAAAAEFTIKGVTGQSSDDANNDANTIGSDQTEYPSASISLTEPNFSYGEWKVAPGQTVKGWVAFELPPGVTVAQVQWAPSLNGAAATWTVSG